jgi:hypothetical protein
MARLLLGYQQTSIFYSHTGLHQRDYETCNQTTIRQIIATESCAEFLVAVAGYPAGLEFFRFVFPVIRTARGNPAL